MAANIRHHPTIWTRFAAILLASWALSACQDEPDDNPPGWNVDAGADTGDDIGADAQDAGPPGCAAPDPSVTCVDTGCDEGEVCEQVGDGCVPSSCVCDEQTGAWECTADCGQDYQCVDASPLECTDPDPSVTCVDTGCAQGFACVETSGCAPSSCFCESGRWSCTSDCGQSYACQPLEGCRALDDADSCESAGCDWRYAGACAEPSSGAVLEESGCFDARECTSSAECGDGESCQPVAIKPDCAVGYPNEPVCDACMMMVTMCY